MPKEKAATNKVDPSGDQEPQSEEVEAHMDIKRIPWTEEDINMVRAVLLKSNASEIRRNSLNFDENIRNFTSIEFSSKVRKFFCFILYENSLSPSKFRCENSKHNFVHSNIRFEFSNSRV